MPVTFAAAAAASANKIHSFFPNCHDTTFVFGHFVHTHISDLRVEFLGFICVMARVAECVRSCTNIFIKLHFLRRYTKAKSFSWGSIEVRVRFLLLLCSYFIVLKWYHIHTANIQTKGPNDFDIASK